MGHRKLAGNPDRLTWPNRICPCIGGKPFTFRSRVAGMGFQLSSFIASDPEMWFEEMRIVYSLRSRDVVRGDENRAALPESQRTTTGLFGRSSIVGCQVGR